MTQRRVKPFAILAVLVVAALALLSASQTWVVLTLDGAPEPVAVGGVVTSPALFAFGVVGLALAGALALAGPGFAVVFGVLEAAVGVSMLLGTIGAIADPVAATVTVVTEHTGVAGAAAAGLVQSAALTPWAWIGVVTGVLTVLVGVAIIVLARVWPQTGRRFQADAVRTESDDVVDWDSLSRQDADAASGGPDDAPAGDGAAARADAHPDPDGR